MFAVGCDDFGDINKSPNAPDTPITSMFFTRASLNVRNFIMTSSSYDPWNALWTGYIAECKNNQFGALSSTLDFSMSSYYYYCIKQLSTIIDLNTNEETKGESNVYEFGSAENQIAASMTLRAFYVMTLSDILGPVPYSQALKGVSEGIWKPDFDSQEDIYSTLDKELKEAYAKFDPSTKLTPANDIFYAGNISKWKKFNATIRMMMAIKLADVAPADGKARFAQAYTDGGMVDVNDGFNYTFDAKNQSSWFYSIGNLDYASRSNQYTGNKFFVDALKKYKDPRLFAYFTLNGYRGNVAGDPKDFDAYKGVTLGHESNPAVKADAAGGCSVQQKYCNMTATYGLITTARCLLVEAEAAKLGWIQADASELYEAGIRASFEFSEAENVDDYIAAHPLPSDKDEALKEIVMQRWLAGFLTDTIESWSDWRRYNIPHLPLTDYQKKKTGHNTYPYRLAYYSDEREYNTENYEKVVEKYFGGVDNRWSRVWWDVADNAE